MISSVTNAHFVFVIYSAYKTIGMSMGENYPKPLSRQFSAPARFEKGELFVKQACRE